MELRHFEQRIKTIFGSHRPETDTDAIWKNIEPHLKKKKKRRGFIWLFAGLGFALFLLSIRHNRHPLLQIQEQVIAENTPTKTGKVVTPAPSARDRQYQASAVQHAVSNGYASITTSNFPSASQPATGKVSIPEKMETAGPAPMQQAKNLNWQDKTYLALLPAVHNNLVISLDSVPKSRVLPVQEDEKKERLFALADPDDPSNKRRKKHGKLRLQHEFSVLAGPGLGISHLGKGEATTEHLDGRKETEHVLESYTAGIYYTAATRKGFFIKTGLDYRQINEKFHLDYIQQEIVYVQGVITQTVDQAGNIVEQTTGNKRAIKTTVYSNTAFNHYYFLNMPIGIGHRVADRRTRQEFSGGLDVNLFFRAKATIYNAENEPTTYSHGGYGYEDMFRHRTGWGIWGAYAYEWKMSDRMYWQLSGSVQIPFHPVSNTNNTVAQQYINLGAQIGGIYKLSKPKKNKSGIAAARAY
jgi:hypothetical protein